MATIEQRLQSLESKQPKANMSGLLMLIEGDITEAQQKQIDDAESIGQDVFRVDFIAPAKRINLTIR